MATTARRRGADIGSGPEIASLCSGVAQNDPRTPGGPGNPSVVFQRRQSPGQSLQADQMLWRTACTHRAGAFATAPHRSLPAVVANPRRADCLRGSPTGVRTSSVNGDAGHAPEHWLRAAADGVLGRRLISAIRGPLTPSWRPSWPMPSTYAEISKVSSSI
jgi:hypothetical protein